MPTAASDRATIDYPKSLSDFAKEKLITVEKMYTSHLYETDFYTWTQQQVSLLKTQQWDQLDTVNLIEEIETLGRRERQELRNCNSRNLSLAGSLSYHIE